MKFLATAFLLSFLAGASGCAYLVNGTDQEIAVKTYPPGADCTVGDQRFKSPAILKLERDTNYLVRCSLDGRSDLAPVTGRVSGWTFADLAIIPIIVDFQTGAAFNLLPKDVFLNLKPEDLKDNGPSVEITETAGAGDVYARLIGMPPKSYVQELHKLTPDERKRLEAYILLTKGKRNGWTFLIGPDVNKKEATFIVRFMNNFSGYKPERNEQSVLE